MLQTDLWELQLRMLWLDMRQISFPGVVLQRSLRRRPQSSEVLKTLLIAVPPFCSPLPNDDAAKRESAETNLLVYV